MRTRNRNRKKQIHRTKKHKQKGGALTPAEAKTIKEYTDLVVSILGVKSPFKNIWRTSVYEYIFNRDYRDVVPGPPNDPKNDPTAQTKAKVSQVQFRLFCWIKDNMPNAVVKMPKGTIFCRTVTRTDLNQLNVLQLQNKKGTLTPKPGTYSNTSIMANVNVQVALPIDSVMFLKTNKDLYYLNLIPFLHLMGMQYKDRLGYIPYGDVSSMDLPREGISANGMEWATSFALNKLGLNGVIQMDYVENIYDSTVTPNPFFFRPSRTVGANGRSNPPTIGTRFTEFKKYAKDYNTKQFFEADSPPYGVCNYFPEFATYNYEDMVNWDIMDLEEEANLFNAATAQEQASWPNNINMFIRSINAHPQGQTIADVLTPYKLIKPNYLTDIDNFSSPAQWTKTLPDGSNPTQMTDAERLKKFKTKKEVVFKTFRLAKKKPPVLYSLDLYNLDVFQLFGVNLSNLNHIVFQQNPGMTDLSAEVFRIIDSTKATHQLNLHLAIGPYHNSMAELPKDIELLKNFKGHFCDMKDECATGEPCCKLDVIPKCEEGNGDFMKVKADATNNFYYNKDFNLFVANMTRELIHMMLHEKNEYTDRLGRVLMRIIVKHINLKGLIKNIARDVHIQNGDVSSEDDGIDSLAMTLLGHNQSDKKDRFMDSKQERQVALTAKRIREYLTAALNGNAKMQSYTAEMTAMAAADTKKDKTDRNALFSELEMLEMLNGDGDTVGIPIDFSLLTLFCNIYLKGGTSFKFLLNHEIAKEEDRAIKEHMINRLDGWKNATSKIEEKLGAPSDYDCNCVINPYLGEKDYITISDILNFNLTQYMCSTLYSQISSRFHIGTGDSLALQKLLMSNPLNLNLHIEIDITQPCPTAARVDGENYERVADEFDLDAIYLNPTVAETSLAFYSKGPMLWITDDDDQAVTQFDLHRLMLNAPLVQICESKDNKLGLGTRVIDGKTCYVTYSSAYVAVELIDVSVVNWGGLEKVQKWQDSVDGLMSDSLYTLYERVKYKNFDGQITNVYPFYGFYEVTYTDTTIQPPNNNKLVQEEVPWAEISKKRLSFSPTLGIYQGAGIKLTDINSNSVYAILKNGTVVNLPNNTNTFSASDRYGVDDIVLYPEPDPANPAQQKLHLYQIVGLESDTVVQAKKYSIAESRFELVYNLQSQYIKFIGWSMGIQMYQFKNSVHDLMVTLQDTIKGGRMAKVLKRQRRLALLSQLYYTFVHIPTSFTKMTDDGPLSILRFDGYELEYTLDPENSMKFLKEFYNMKINRFDAISILPVDTWGRIYTLILACITLHRDKVRGFSDIKLGNYSKWRDFVNNAMVSLESNLRSIFMDTSSVFKSPPIGDNKWTPAEKKALEVYFINILTQMISIMYDSNVLGPLFSTYAMQMLMTHLINDVYTISLGKNMSNNVSVLNGLNERLQTYQRDIAKLGETVINRLKVIKGTDIWMTQQQSNVEKVMMSCFEHGCDVGNIRLVLKFDSAKSIYRAILGKNGKFDITHMDIASNEKKVKDVLAELPEKSPIDMYFDGTKLYCMVLDYSFDTTLKSLMPNATDVKPGQWRFPSPIYCTSMIPGFEDTLNEVSFKHYLLTCNEITMVPPAEHMTIIDLAASLSAAYGSDFVPPPFIYTFPNIVRQIPGFHFTLSVYNNYKEQHLMKKQMAKSTNINELKMYIDQIFDSTTQYIDKEMIEQLQLKDQELQKLTADNAQMLSQLHSMASTSSGDVKAYSLGLVNALGAYFNIVQQGIDSAIQRGAFQVADTRSVFSLTPNPPAYVIDLNGLRSGINNVLSQLSIAQQHLT
jgi:hypothetical protein